MSAQLLLLEMEKCMLKDLCLFCVPESIQILQNHTRHINLYMYTYICTYTSTGKFYNAPSIISGLTMSWLTSSKFSWPILNEESSASKETTTYSPFTLKSQTL